MVINIYVELKGLVNILNKEKKRKKNKDKIKNKKNKINNENVRFILSEYKYKLTVKTKKIIKLLNDI